MTSQKPKIFVISQIGQADSPERTQADDVLALIRQGAPEYDVVRADEQEETKITDAMLKSLTTSQVVVTYLGTDAINPNVMFETGYRLATGKPILLIGHQDTTVPFDLQDIRHYKIPNPEDLKAGPNANLNTAKGIGDEIRAIDKAQLLSPYAAAEIVVDLTPGKTQEERAANTIFTMASPLAETLFNKPDGLTGLSIHDVLNDLEDHVVKEQWQAFHDEQTSLIGRLLFSKTENDATNIRAKVPFIFRSDAKISDEICGRAFLALMYNYNLREQGLCLHVLYYDVSAQLEKCPGGHFVFNEEAPAAFPGQLN